MSNGIRFFTAGPLTLVALIILVVLLILIIPLLLLGLVGAAFTKLGFSWITALAVVLLILLGSRINIPVYRIRRDTVRFSQKEYFYQNGTMPTQIWETILLVNFGGAVLPVCVSAYLLYRATQIAGTPLFYPVGLGVLAVVLVSAITTQMIPGIGFKVPLLLPALAALLAGLLLSAGTGLSAAVIAFVSGTVGTLLGANVAHLFKVKDLEVPGVSIGGEGTFGAIFLCCILPALIA
jgi:uncharacterized membrane protein